MTRRPAATLMEVLVSIFIMGIGLLAILALFPLGAFRMAQAIQDDRAGHMALNGAALAKAFDLRNDKNVVFNFTHVRNPDPQGRMPPYADRPSYPVFLDPVGVQAGADLFVGSKWVSSDNTQNPVQRTAITRWAPANMPSLAGVPAWWQWFTLTDDLRFDKTGVPANPVEREGTLSFALMLRRPRSSVANVVELSIVVYNRRPLSMPSAEAPYQATFNPGSNTVQINYGVLPAPVRPAVQPGSWILDTTYKQEPIGGSTWGWAHAYFYRVVNVTDVSPGVVELELATPLRDWPSAGVGTVIFMDNVVEVLEKGTGW